MPSFDPERGRAAGGSPVAPSIPSFQSLRDPRKRTAVDVLAPGRAPAPAPEPVPAQPAQPAAPAPDVPAPDVPAPDVPAPDVPAPDVAVGAASRTPRPAEYADLLHFGLRLASTLAGVPFRLARWSVTEPARCLRRLSGR